MNPVGKPAVEADAKAQGSAKPESPKQSGQPVQVEEPLLIDYASNNYWKRSDSYKLEDLESNYS